MGKDRGLYRGKRSDTDDWIYGFYAKSGDAENINEIHCRDCKKLVSFDDICEVMCKPLNRPPQSYMFVEEVRK